MNKDRAKYNAYMRQYMLNRYRVRKAKIIERLGGKCAKCGSTEALEIDHPLPRKQHGGFVITSIWSWSDAKLETEIVKCQLLCRSCHRLKTNVENPLSHERAVEMGRLSWVKRRQRAEGTS